MDSSRKYPIGIQDFESLRRDGYIYVDKTEQIYKLISRGKYYFLFRPRRFGKSLLISTLRAYFEGKKELFDGTVGQRLAIADKADITWENYPVLRLDFNTQKYDTPESLNYVLDKFLRAKEKELGIHEGGEYFGPRFESVIQVTKEKTGKNVVILVDEYDKPLLQAIDNLELQDAFRSTLKGFYGALKSMDEYIKFAFLTGVTKFSKVSIFSDLNNLNDISMSPAYWDICGITANELETEFKADIEILAETNEMTSEECLNELRLRYDGYHFHHSPSGVYNPFSVMCTFEAREFGSYWFNSGTPTYLVKLFQMHDYNLASMLEENVSADRLNQIYNFDDDPIPVIYQSGYLTIKDFNKEFESYRLGFPNKEVEKGFINFLLPCYTSLEKNQSPFKIEKFVTEVKEGKTEQFLERLRSLFADTPYELIKDLENHYQNVLWLVTKLLGFYVMAEYHTSRGRIDMILQTSRFCYVMEFKLDGTAEEALQQISDKDYTLPFEMNGRKIIRIGLNFDSASRNIERYVIG